MKMTPGPLSHPHNSLYFFSNSVQRPISSSNSR